MNLEIADSATVSDILNTVEQAEAGSHIYCGTERHFSLLKICLIKLQKSDLNIYLLDQHGFTVKQVSAHKKQAVENLSEEASLAEASGENAGVAAAEPVPQSHSADAAVVDQKSSTAAVELRPQAEEKSQQEGLSSKQISAVRDLEQNLRRCKELGLLLVGFSDGLVVVPETMGCGTAAISSAEALEVEAFDVYRGYDAEEEGGEF